MYCGWCIVTSSIVIASIQLQVIFASVTPVVVPHRDNGPQSASVREEPAAAATAEMETLHLLGHVNNHVGSRAHGSHTSRAAALVLDTINMSSLLASRYIRDVHSSEARVAAVPFAILPRRRSAYIPTRSRRSNGGTGQYSGNSGRQSGGSRRKGHRTTTTMIPSESWEDMSWTPSVATGGDVSTINAIPAENAEEDVDDTERRRVGAVVILQDKPQNVAADWMWTASFVTVNTEKLILYSMLSIAFGAVAILLVIVGLLHCRGRHRRSTEGPGDGSRDALNAVGSGNVYTPSPASSEDTRHLASEAGSPSAWWSRDDEAKSHSGSLNHPPTPETATIPRRFPTTATSGNGWMSEGDATSLATSGGTTASRQGLPPGRPDRSGRNQIDDADVELLRTSTDRAVAMGYDVGKVEVNGGDCWLSRPNGEAVDGTDVGTLGRSFTNPYRHDSYRTDGMRTMQFK